jgi:hypothetical protein
MRGSGNGRTGVTRAVWIVVALVLLAVGLVLIGGLLMSRSEARKSVPTLGTPLQPPAPLPSPVASETPIPISGGAGLRE